MRLYFLFCFFVLNQNLQSSASLREKNREQPNANVGISVLECTVHSGARCFKRVHELADCAVEDKKKYINIRNRKIKKQPSCSLTHLLVLESGISQL